MLISVIGDPRNYGLARYHYAGAVAERRFSSSVILDVEKPDRSVLITQYTMAKRGNNFESLQRETIEYIRGFIKDVDRFEHKIIAPGVIRIKDENDGREYDFRGDIFNFYAYVLYSLARFFEGLSGDVEVILDLTHGINYMGYLTLRAVSLILDIYSMVNNAKLKVVNSDPYSRRGNKQAGSPQVQQSQETPELNINVVLEKSITPTFNYPASSRTELLHPYLGSNKEKERLGKELTSLSKDMKECMSNQEHFINAINRGALLAAYTFADDFGKCVDWAVDYFAKNVHVDPRQSFVVTPKYSFTETFESLVIAEMIKKVTGIDRKSEVRLEELDNKAEIYSKSRTIYSIVESEIYRIEKMIKEVIGLEPGIAESWTKLTYYADKMQKKKYSENPNDDRTFFAHAGMPYAFVEVKGATKELRYSDDAIEKLKRERFLKC